MKGIVRSHLLLCGSILGNARTNNRMGSEHIGCVERDILVTSFGQQLVTEKPEGCRDKCSISSLL